jgi:DNA-binding MarR family transcriptional regulator
VEKKSAPRVTKPDKVVHERGRLLIMTHLAGREDGNTASFTELRDALGYTPGNLSIQLKLLSENGYVEIRKRFQDNKPLTTVSLTSKGWKALDSYIEEMKRIIDSLSK